MNFRPLSYFSALRFIKKHLLPHRCNSCGILKGGEKRERKERKKQKRERRRKERDLFSQILSLIQNNRSLLGIVADRADKRGGGEVKKREEKKGGGKRENRSYIIMQK